MQFVPIPTPFTILIDSKEQHPFRFSGLLSDSHQGYRPIDVKFRWQALGTANGDYSLDGFEPPPATVTSAAHSSPELYRHLVDRPSVSVERKSIEDCIGTVLGFGERRERFENELQNLSRLTSACVVVEGTMSAVLNAIETSPHDWKKSPEDLRKTLFRSWIAFAQDYGVPWFFCDDRRLAEITCFRFLERFHRKYRAVLHQANLAEATSPQPSQSPMSLSPSPSSPSSPPSPQA